MTRFKKVAALLLGAAIALPLTDTAQAKQPSKSAPKISAVESAERAGLPSSAELREDLELLVQGTEGRFAYQTIFEKDENDQPRLRFKTNAKDESGYLIQMIVSSSIGENRCLVIGTKDHHDAFYIGNANTRPVDEAQKIEKTGLPSGIHTQLDTMTIMIPILTKNGMHPPAPLPPGNDAKTGSNVPGSNAPESKVGLN